MTAGARAAALGLLLAAATTLAAAVAPPASDDDRRAGERLYRDGLRADGSALTARREPGLTVRGREAACIACHRASGMGGAEGSTAVPPVVGAVLRTPGQPRGPRSGRVAAALQREAAAAEARPAYTPVLLQRALVHGIGAGGRAMDPLMPRYALDDDEVRQLGAYLDTLTIGTAPGHDGTTLHLATVVTTTTPDADRAASATLLARCLAERSPPPGAPDTPAVPAWVLHEWTLGPDPHRWADELATWQQRQPVFALVSGITGPAGRGPWQPLQAHCERERMPCLLPHTAAIDDELPSHWTFHFSRGVSQEAAAMAQHLIEQAPPAGWRHVRQLVAPDDEAARIGARHLQQHLTAAGLTVTARAAAGDGVPATLAALGPDDALVLWLPPRTLQAMTQRHAAPPAAAVLVSGELAGIDTPVIAPTWWPALRLTHPWDPAERHLPRLALNAGRWLARHDLPLAGDATRLRLQAHSYSTCEVAASALRRMGARVGREHFLELVESAEETATAVAYPRFTLGPGQRHGSQGAWLMRIEPAADGTPRLRPVGERLTAP